MAKKKDNLLGPVSQAASSLFPTNGDLVPFGATQVTTREEQRISTEWHKQTLVMDATAAKSVFGMSKIKQIHEHGALTFDATLRTILTVKTEAEGPEQQGYMEAFAQRQIQVVAQQLLGVTEVGAGNIAVEVHRSLYPPPEPDRKPGFFERLFGERE